MAFSVESSFLSIIENNFKTLLSEKVTNVEKELAKVNKRFFKKLITKMIDRVSAPNLDEFTPVWQPLSPNYKKKKASEGYSINFFMRTGKLKSDLNNLDATTIFGTPLIFFQSESKSLGNFFSEKRVGSPDRKLVVRDSKGRFSKVPVTSSELKGKLVVFPYGRRRVGQDLDEYDFFAPEIAEKFRVAKGGRLRPILTNYIEWFISRDIKQAIERGLN